MNLAEDFKSQFSKYPEIITAAPGRVNLIGEHVDYCEGLVLPFAIADRTFAAIGRRLDRKIVISSRQQNNDLFLTSLDELEKDSAGGWERYICGVIWAFGLKIDQGVNILIDGQVTPGAGLSSSAALECSVALALNKIFKINFSLSDLALLTQRAENEYVGVPCGIMDQSVSLQAEAGHALLLDCRDLSTRQIQLDFDGAGLQLLIIDTKSSHELTDGGYAKRRKTCESAADKLGVKTLRDLSIIELNNSQEKLTDLEFRRSKHVVEEIARVRLATDAVENSDYLKLGEILSESHRSLRDLFVVSSPELDLTVEVSLESKSLGARMIGGGFGGSAIALFHLEDIEQAKIEISSAFKRAGYLEPKFFTSSPSAGAEVIELRLLK